MIGRRIAIEGVGHQIVGVLPARFAYPERHRRRVASAARQPAAGRAAARRGIVVALLQPGVTPDAAGQALRRDLGRAAARRSAGSGARR